MLIPNLPLADLTDIINHFIEVGHETGFTLQQFIAQCIAFTVLALVLNRFAWKPVRTILEQRREAIEQSMTNVEKIKKELAEAEAARLSLIQKANEQANAIIAEAQRTANLRAERRAREAAAQADDIIRKSHEAAVLERDRLLAELKRQVGSLVIQTTAKVSGKVLTPDDQARLNSETVREINAANN
jgi:F-type H+-transporting ATPase subunit b